jgi:hypothetical protein
MIYIFVGNDNKKKNIKLKTLTKNREIIVLKGKDLSKPIILDYANTQSLFGELPVVVLDNLIGESEIILSKEELENVQNSETIFVFMEDKLLVADVKKYSKYGEIENFDEKINKVFKNDSFIIADYFASRDKVKTWVAYNEAIEKGVTGEAIAGMLFWKVKTMIQNGSKVFSKNELKNQSSKLVSLYHKAHNGELDMATGLEQFILSVLNK